MVGIKEEIKDSFRRGTAVTKLIYINLAVFVAVKLLFVFYFLFNASPLNLGEKTLLFQNKILIYLMLPASLPSLIVKPWTLISYMFLHWNFLHILGNLLWLFWFGRIFLRYLNEKQLLSTYLLGGLAGAFLYILAYNVFPGLRATAPLAVAYGASASVTAIVFAISAYAPNYTINLFFIGPVKLKHILIVYLLFDLIMIGSDNAGGHIAHLGGAAYGYLFARMLKGGKDIGKRFSNFLDALVTLFKRKPHMKVSYKSNASQMDDYEYNKSKAEHQKEIDRILDKISKSGYESLTKSEKKTLFKNQQ